MVEDTTVGALERDESDAVAIGSSGLGHSLPEQHQAHVVDDGDLQSATQPEVHDDQTRTLDEQIGDKPKSSGGESAEQLLPIPPSRTGLTHDKARALFEKHGVKYEPEPLSSRSRTAQSSPQRVEKPIRIRVHWTCHDCHAQFGSHPVCENCGHARCEECYKAPPRRVKEALDNALSEREGDEENTMARQRGSAPVQLVAANPPDPKLPPVTQLAQPHDVLEARTPGDMPSDDDDLPPASYLLILQQTPTSAYQLANNSSTRRTCHQCRTPLANPTPTRCSHCNHTICASCPREPIRRDQWAYGAAEGREISGQQPKPVTTVQRVYRKPRQRIRWTCHECETMFIDRKDCKSCGHARCRDCPRTP